MVIKALKDDLSEEERQLSRIFRALGEPNRLRIIRILVTEGEMGCGELAERAGLSPSTLSHHLTVMMGAGVVDGRKEGKAHIVSIQRKELERYAPGVLTCTEGS